MRTMLVLLLLLGCLGNYSLNGEERLTKCISGDCRNGYGVLADFVKGVKSCEMRGLFSQGLLNGRVQTTCWSKGGEKVLEFDGFFREGMREGFGIEVIFDFSNGRVLQRYEGCWKDDERAPEAKCKPF